MMKKFQKLLTLFTVVSFMLMGLTACSTKDNTTASHDDQASGTIEIDETQVMLLVGGTYGGGTLNFQGETYKFKIKGLKLGGIGMHKVVLTGDVYKLNDIKDFAGTYFAAEAGLTVVKGMGGYWLKNGNGVALHLTSKAEGLALAVGVEGLKIKM
jgi:hypothetical protein